VHPDVYVAVLHSLRQVFPFEAVLLITDSTLAVHVLRRAFGTMVKVRDFDRSNYTPSKGLKGRHRWIDHRNDLDPAVVSNSLMDLTHLVEGGFFVGGLCGFFSQAAYLLASYHHGSYLPYVSVDECELQHLGGFL